MKRISRQYTVPQEQRHKVRQPVAEVELGETFIVETINDPSPIIRTPADANPKVIRGRQETGPIFVKGCRAGDVLAIEIIDIHPEGHAAAAGKFLEIKDGQVHYPGGLRRPVRMMIGDIRLQPAEENWNPWDYGGNMDFREICTGNTLCLKAQLDGGLMVLGDLHAYQGDGELLGMAAECAGEVTLRITKDTKYLSDRPLIVKKDSIVFLACRRPYESAKDLALDDATKVFTRLARCCEPDARLYVTLTGELRNGAIWMMGKTDQDWYKYVPFVVGLEVPLPR